MLRRIVIVVLVLAALGAVVAWFTRSKPIPVVLKEVAEGKVEATLANTRAGTVEACQRTKLSTIVGGRIEFLGVKEGDKVKKGDLLLEMDLDKIAAAAHPAVVITVVTNTDDFKDVEVVASGAVEPGADLIKVSK